MTASSISLAQSASDSGTTSKAGPINLDLGSSERNLSAAHLVGEGSVNILVSGSPVSINAASLLTPAERLAVYQVVSTGAQSIILGASGTATGGNLVIGSRFNNYVSSLSVPQNVTVLLDAAQSPVMNLTGNLTNSGTIYAFSSNSQVNSASIAALNIINQPGSLLSSMLPASTNFGAASLVSSMNLNLSAVQNIVNSGTIISSGNLSVTAGGSITNVIGLGSLANNPIMQAAGALNLQAPNVVNQGILASLTNNLNISTASLTNSAFIQAAAGNLAIQNLIGNTLSINNLLGEISARDMLRFSTSELAAHDGNEGNILTPAVLSVDGGTLSAAVVGFESPCGDINLDVYRLNGDINIKSTNANIKVEGGSLNIASLDLSGDPSFTNVTGDVNLGPGPASPGTASFNIFGAGPVFTTGGALFNVSAGGNIVALNGAAGTVDASLFGGTGGAITLTAGTSATGGSVILPQVNFKTNGNTIQITATATKTNAGSVSVGTLNTSGAGGVCCKGGPGAPGQAAGSITINAPGGISTGSLQAFGGGGAGGFCCDSSGGAGGNGGAVQLLSNGNIVIGGEINTSGGGGGGLAASQTIGTTGGNGGGAGNITVTTPGSFTSFGPLLAAGGGGGSGNTAKPCCPQAYRNGGGSFGGGGGGGDVGAGGGGFYGGGGSLSFGSGGGGGFFGGGGGSNGQPNGSLGSGGSSTEAGTLFFTGGVFGAAGGGAGSSGGDGNLINNTFVAQKGFGNAGGAPGINGSIAMTTKSVQVVAPVGQFFPGAGFTSSPFSNVTVFGNYSGPQVNLPGGGAAPTNTPSTFALPSSTSSPTSIQIGLSAAQIAALNGLTSLDGSQSGGIRNFDTSGIQNVTDWGLMMASTGSAILVNSPESNKSLAGVLAYQATGVSSVGNSLSAALNSLDTDIGQINVALSRLTGVDYNAPGHEATGLSQSGPLVGTLEDPITIAMINGLFALIEIRNDLAAKQAAIEGRYSWTVIGTENDGGFYSGAMPTYDGSDGFTSLASYNQGYTEWLNRPTTQSTFSGSNAQLAKKLMEGSSIDSLVGGQGEGPSGGEGSSEGSTALGKSIPGISNGIPVKMTPYTTTKPDGTKETGVITSWGKDGTSYKFPGASLVNGGPKGASGNTLTLQNGQRFFIPPNGQIMPGPNSSGLSLKDPNFMTQGPIDSTTGGFRPGTNNRSTTTTPEQNQRAIDGLTPHVQQTPEPLPMYDLPFMEALSAQPMLIASVPEASAETKAFSGFTVPNNFKRAGKHFTPYPVLAGVEQERHIQETMQGLQKSAPGALTDLDTRVSSSLVGSPIMRFKAFAVAVKLKIAAKQQQQQQQQAARTATKRNPLVDFDIARGNTTLTAQFPWVETLNSLDACSAHDAVKQSLANIASSNKNENVFLCPKQKIVLKIKDGTVSIKAHAKILVLKNDDCTAIYNLHDNHRDDVQLHRDGNSFSIAPGRFVVLCNKRVADFDRINPARPIAYRSLKELPGTNITIFAGEFSPVTALMSVSCLKDLAHTANVEDKKTYRELIKTSVALIQMQRAGEPFKTTASIPTANKQRVEARVDAHVPAERISLN